MLFCLHWWYSLLQLNIWTTSGWSDENFSKIEGQWFDAPTSKVLILQAKFWNSWIYHNEGWFEAKSEKSWGNLELPTSNYSKRSWEIFGNDYLIKTVYPSFIQFNNTPEKSQSDGSKEIFTIPRIHQGDTSFKEVFDIWNLYGPSWLLKRIFYLC